MPQLNSDIASAVDTAVNPTGLIDEGIYLARLDGAVEAKAGEKTTTWFWPFTLEADQPFAGRKIKHLTWLSEASYWRLKNTFDAFGVPTSTDTDELEGRKVRLHIVQKEDYRGELDDEGLVKLVNDIKEILPEAGSTGVDEAAKARRIKMRKAALESVASDSQVAGGDNEPLF